MSSLKNACFLILASVLCTVSQATQPARLQTEAEEIVSSIIQSEPELPWPFRTPVSLGTEPLSIHRAVEIALANNPALTTQRENIRYMALDVLSTRRDFFPKFRANLFFSQSESAITNDVHRTTTDRTLATQTLSMTEQFPFGGQLGVDVGTAYSELTDRDNEFSPSAAVFLRMPLLRGFGIQYNTNNLVQRRQNLRYALRAFKLQQEELAIRTTDNFLSLLRTQRRLEFLEKRYNAAERLFRQTTAFHRIGRANSLDLARVEQEALRVERDLSGARTAYANQTDDFKVFLNLPASTSLKLQDWEPPDQLDWQPPSESEAIAQALSRRVDLITAADAIDDAKRTLGIAKNNLLPDLDLGVRASTANTSRSRYSVLNEDYSASVGLSLPLTHNVENLRFFDAYQDLQQSERNLQVARFAIESSIRSGLRVLANVETALRIQEKLLLAARRRVQIAQIRYDAGETWGWEVIDAQNALLSETYLQMDLKQSQFIGLLRMRSATGNFNLDRPLPLASLK